MEDHPLFRTEQAKESAEEELVKQYDVFTEGFRPGVAGRLGIDDAYTQKIIDGRPCVKKKFAEIKNDHPGATYDKIKGQIVAK